MAPLNAPLNAASQTQCPFLLLSHKMDEILGILKAHSTELVDIQQALRDEGITARQETPVMTSGARKIQGRDVLPAQQTRTVGKSTRPTTRSASLQNADKALRGPLSGSAGHTEKAGTSTQKRKNTASGGTSIQTENNDHTSRMVKKPRLVPEVMISLASRSTAERSTVSTQITRKSNAIQVKDHYAWMDAIPPPILDEGALAECMRLINTDVYRVTMDPRIRSIAVSRAFISSYFGGTQYGIRPSVVSRHPEHYKNFLFPSLYANPHLPREPGQPGVFYRIERAARSEDWAPIQKVLVRLERHKWQYMGEYRISLSSRSMKPKEFRKMPVRLRSEFATKVASRDEDKDVRSRLGFLREHGYEPTIQETEEAMTKRYKYEFSPKQIEDAIESGELVVVFWCMECVGYDIGFQKEIATHGPPFDRREMKRKADSLKAKEVARE